MEINMQLESTAGVSVETCFLSTSIVVYRPDLDLLDRTLKTLSAALQCLNTRMSAKAPLYIVDNGTAADRIALPDTARSGPFDTVLIEGHGNVGYGRGHNLAIEQSTSDFHLILNPDIELDRDALAHAVKFMLDEPATGLISPMICDEAGRQQFLCRRFPTVLDLFVRGFLPARLRAPFKERLAHYEMRDTIDGKNVVWDPPIVSGCFMLFRTDVLKKLGGFDPRYFLYFEDYDLSLRTHEVARVAYVPSVHVLHHGGNAARKGWAHIKLFVTSAFRFFNRFGWKWI